MNKKEELHTCDSYIDGEEFVYSLPDDPFEIEAKISNKYIPHSVPNLVWDPWPTTLGVERRVGNWVLRLGNDKNMYRLYQNASGHVRLIKKHDEKQWYFYYSNRINGYEGKYPLFAGLSLRELYEKATGRFIGNHDATGELHDFGNKLFSRMYDETDFITIKEKVFGKRRSGFTRYAHSICENEKNICEVFLSLEWYRKQILKIQKKTRIENKKRAASEKGITLEELRNIQNNKEEQEKRILRTQQWVNFSNDVHSSLSFLQSLIDSMSDDREISQEWFDKGRRDMRKLSNTLRPMRTHFEKSKK